MGLLTKEMTLSDIPLIHFINDVEYKNRRYYLMFETTVGEDRFISISKLNHRLLETFLHSLSHIKEAITFTLHPTFVNQERGYVFTFNRDEFIQHISILKMKPNRIINTFFKELFGTEIDEVIKNIIYD